MTRNWEAGRRQGKARGLENHLVFMLLLLSDGGNLQPSPPAVITSQEDLIGCTQAKFSPLPAYLGVERANLSPLDSVMEIGHYLLQDCRYPKTLQMRDQVQTGNWTVYCTVFPDRKGKRESEGEKCLLWSSSVTVQYSTWTLLTIPLLMKIKCANQHDAAPPVQLAALWSPFFRSSALLREDPLGPFVLRGHV